MSANRSLRRWVSVLGTTAVFGLVIGLLWLNRDVPNVSADDKEKKAPAGKPGARSWPLFGGTVQRNLVNLTEKNIPTDWSVKAGAEKNIKWSVPLGSKAYGGPIVSGGKIYIGTNNNRPRNKEVHGDKGIVMCFNEATGELLWQSIHDKLP